MQPEILRRCLSCGASIRESAIFCPECGKPLAATEQKGLTGDGAERKRNDGSLVGDDKPPAPRVSESIGDKITLPVASKPYQARDAKGPGPKKRTRESLHRASSVARGAIEDNVKRVEKIHHVSTVMLEEATYDPSLRFVLVALGLFILFIILLVVSKVMG